MDELGGSAPQSSRTWVKVLVVLGVLALVCCGGVLIFVVPKAVQFASLTPEEQQERMSGMVEDLAGDRDIVARTFIDHLSVNEIDEALALCTAQFRTEHGRDGLAKDDRKIDAVMGALNEIHLLTFNMNRSGFGGGTTTIELTYKGEYANGDGTISMRLVESADGTAEVERYNVNSPLFLDASAPDDDGQPHPEPAPKPTDDE